MRILFDALGSTEKSGGMRLHSTQVIESWSSLYPDDEVWIVGPAWVSERFGSLPNVTVVEWRNESVVFRATGQILVSALVAAQRRVDYAISLSPLVSPLIARRKAICFQHDWRHKRNPWEFPFSQRLYRKLWELSAGRAKVNVCISSKAARETEEYVPGSRTVVIENGRDHARSWPPFVRKDGRPRITTFGHHNNKRPELVIEAIGALKEKHGISAELTVLGARGAYAAELRDLACTRNVAENMQFPGFVSEPQYQEIVATSTVVVMASTDEGFGLPVAEAQFLGIPAVVTKDSGMGEIFGSYPFVAEPDGESLADAIAEAMATMESPRDRPHMMTWRDTAGQLRAVLENPVVTRRTGSNS